METKMLSTNILVVDIAVIINVIVDVYDWRVLQGDSILY